MKDMIVLDRTDSTNRYMSALSEKGEVPHGTTVIARSQTAGRGQRGNTWVSEPGSNITMSILLRPCSIQAREQFYITEIVALAIVDILDSIIRPEDGCAVTIKWPNDIYVGNKKICGTLIENTLCGVNVSRSIAGIGLNINQGEFVSDAPNPVSVLNVTGTRHDVMATAERLASRVVTLFGQYDRPSMYGRLHDLYRSRLWRSDGFYKYRDASSGELFDAEIADVEPMGFLVLRTHGGELRRYAFKEVSAVLEDF